MESLRALVEKTGKALSNTECYLETHYQSVLAHFIQQEMKDWVVSREVNLSYQLPDGFVFGFGRIDLVVENKDECIILELKANVSTKECYLIKHMAQLRRYLRHYPKKKKSLRGMLVVFSPGECKIVTEENV